MTAQFPDVFEYDGRTWHLAGISEGHLFEPDAFGLAISASISACWRGYEASFRLRDDHLVLAKLVVSLAAGAEAPPINGVEPVAPKKGGFSVGDSVYNDVDLAMSYTGGLLLAHGFIRGLYAHMGFHPPWKYEEVLELIFEAGHLVGVHDRSDAMASERRRATTATETTTSPVGETDELERWIVDAFDRSYKR